ncbi:hypothetical protein M0R45_019184 [Rubus argutus]|uniref:Uncharacterized protein n=1 Tax=Rubus argutus TaxID=59490 RepID=A0AAW1X6B3_RUBAR
MANQKSFLLFIFVLLFSLGIKPLETKEVIRVPVGVVLNLKSSVGAMAENYMTMALSDFYAKHAHYKTRLSLRTRDSKDDVVSAAFEALHLINIERYLNSHFQLCTSLFLKMGRMMIFFIKSIVRNMMPWWETQQL